MNPAAESDYGFQADNYTPAMRFRKDPNGNFWEPDAGAWLAYGARSAAARRGRIAALGS